jgi:hypothetical protein
MKNKNAGIPKSAPETTREAYGRILELAEAVGALRVAGASELHSLRLPPEAVRALGEAHQALLAAHRAVEAAVLGGAS